MRIRQHSQRHMTMIRSDRIWDLGRPIFHDGPAWAYHFDDDGRTTDQMPLFAFAAPAVFLDLRETVHAGEPIAPAELNGPAESLHDGDVAVLVTGWGAKSSVGEEYPKRWPYLDGRGARLLLEHGISGVGIDALSVGGWGETDDGEPSQAALLSAGKVIIEELNIPDQLTGRRCFLIAFPVPLEGCAGERTRAAAREFCERAVPRGVQPASSVRGPTRTASPSCRGRRRLRPSKNIWPERQVDIT